MPDLADRAEFERKLARAIGQVSRAQMGQLLELLGDPPLITNVPQSFWDDGGKELLEAVRPLLTDAYVASAQQMLATVPSGIDWVLINQRATTWAQQYAFDLVRGITETTQGLLQSSVGTFYEHQLTIGELTDLLESAFGPVRAAMIAETETTRAAVNGEWGLVEELRGIGIEMIAIWQTENDEIVCPVCGPRHETRQGEGWDDPPPAHPRCRCNLRYEIKE